MRKCGLAILFLCLLSLVPGVPVNEASEPVRVSKSVTPMSAEETPPSPGPARAHIDGPKDGFPGDFIDLDAGQSICDPGCLRWFVKPPRFGDGKPTYKVSSDRRTCQLASRPGTYTVVLAVSNASGPDLMEWVVTVTNTIPSPAPPVPQPTDPTNPTPPVNPPVSPTLSDWILDEGTTWVGDANRQMTATKLSSAYRQWAANGGVSKDAVEFAKVQDALNKTILVSQKAAAGWDKFFTMLAKKLSGMNLDTVAKSQAAWLQIADGLDRLSKVPYE